MVGSLDLHDRLRRLQAGVAGEEGGRVAVSPDAEQDELEALWQRRGQGNAGA